MKKKTLLPILFVGALILIPFLYWTISPLFVNKRVSEDLPTGANGGGNQGIAVGEPNPSAPGGLQLPEEEMEDVVMDEPMDSNVNVLRKGEFMGRAGHKGSGTASILSVDGKTVLRFEEDFSVTNGPDLVLYFGNAGEWEKDAQIAPLKGNIGSQNYEIPDNINVEDYSEVWVWCRAFSVPFAVAVLK